MRSADLFLFVARSLRGQPLKTAMVTLATAVGVAGVLILTWVGDSARRYVTEEFAALGSNLIVVLPGRTETSGGAPPILGGTERDLTLDDALALLRIESVRRVAPVIFGSAPVSFDRRNREAAVLGSTPDLLAVRRLTLADGRAWHADDPHRAEPVCILGGTIANELFAGESSLHQWVRIGDRRFRVVGTIASSGRALGIDLDEMVVIPVASAQALFDSPALFRILIEARQRESLDDVAEEIEEAIALRHEGKRDVTVITQDAVLQTFDQILGALTVALGSIVAISLLVAGVLVMNVMIIAVSQRREEIGLLKTLGSTSAGIMRIFLAEALALSLSGTIVGILSGLSVSFASHLFLPRLPLVAPLWAFGASCSVAIAVALVFGIIPARRAAALDPVEALAKR